VAGAAAKSLLLAGFTTLAPACALLAMELSAGQALLAAGAALLLWLAGIVILRHPLLDEFDLMRRKLAASFLP